MDEIKQARGDIKRVRQSLRSQRRYLECERASMLGNVEAARKSMREDAEASRMAMHVGLEAARVSMRAEREADRASLLAEFKAERAFIFAQVDAQGGEELVCVACTDFPRNTVCIPCGHICLCAVCNLRSIRRSAPCAARWSRKWSRSTLECIDRA